MYARLLHEACPVAAGYDRIIRQITRCTAEEAPAVQDLMEAGYRDITVLPPKAFIWAAEYAYRELLRAKGQDVEASVQ